VWQIEVRTDLLRGHFVEEARCYCVYEVSFVVARKAGTTYMHKLCFLDDRPRAERFAQRIREARDFTPEGKPELWAPIRDLRPVRPAARNWHAAMCKRMGPNRRRPRSAQCYSAGGVQS
jgi:hypothetical protein